MDEDNGGISRAPPTASHSNPLKKLKKKFNKLKHGGVRLYFLQFIMDLWVGIAWPHYIL